jgi:hypothetical protein
MNDTATYQTARRQVARKIGFLIHLTVFATVNTGLILLNLLVAHRTIWAIWPLLGWGIGLLFHGAATWLFAPGAQWKERMIENELKKRQARQ